MRTTIELAEHQHAALVRLAKRRGDRTLSAIIREALDQYLADHAHRDEATREALAVRGALTTHEADALLRETGSLRATWR
jgi:predicted transcriptional regulator